MNYTARYCESLGRPPEVESVPVFRGEHQDARRALLHHCASIAIDGEWAEFGVRKGDSARHLFEVLPETSRLHLFDSWAGLPLPWKMADRRVHQAGKGACEVPDFGDARSVIHEGLFEDTLPAWKDAPEVLGLVNIDCDIYESTRTVLIAIEPMLRTGSVVVFDELIGYENWRDGEYRALQEWLKKTGREVEYIGRTRFFQVAIRVVR